MLCNSSPCVPSRAAPGAAHPLGLVLLTLLLAIPALAQPTPPEIPPGHVLTGDLILPVDVVYGDGVHDGNIWPGGVVPFTYSSNVSAANRTRAIDAMAEIEAISGVTFVPRSTQSDYIRFVDSTRNSSQVGRVGGRQDVNMFNWTFRYIIVHELMHALSYWHEQQRPDRNTFVTINTGNIEAGAAGNFTRRTGGTTTGGYDFSSIMHYRDNAFGINGARTITARPAYASFQSAMGNRSYMTDRDAQAIQARYGTGPRPTITSITPAIFAAGSSSTTITVNGTSFFRGSPNSNGVQGTTVLIDGSPVTTTFVNTTRVTFTMSSARLANGTCYRISVTNETPGGGESAARTFSVYEDIGTPEYSYGRDFGSGHGTAVAMIGDINGDGAADYAVGAPGYDSNRGRVSAISGATGRVLWARSSGTSYEYGRSVVNIGDINGDDIADLAVGAPGYATGRGLVRWINGFNGNTIRTTFGAVQNDRFGFALASHGDVDGSADGILELAVGAPNASSNAGQVTVYNGASGALFRTFTGSLGVGSGFGSALAGGFDLGGDGVPELAIGAPEAAGGGTRRGAVQLRAGASGATLFTRNGLADYDDFGASLAMVARNDGAPLSGNLVIGAPERGRFVLFGGGGVAPEQGYVQVIGRDLTAGFYSLLNTFNGASNSDNFGVCVASVGDWDQDGSGDFAIGANDAANILVLGTIGTGYVDVVSGASFDVICRMEGSDDADRYGTAIAGGADVHGDGSVNIIIGAPGADEYCTSQGEVHSPAGLIIAPSFEKVMITEVSWGDPDGIEIHNFSDEDVNLNGWTASWFDATTRVSAPLNVTIAANETIVICEPGTVADLAPGIRLLSAFPSLPSVSGALTVSLQTASGVVIDEVRVSSTGGAAPVSDLGGFFRGLADRDSSLSTSRGSVERIWGLDSNSGGDWTAQNVRSFGRENTSSGPRGTDPVALPRVLMTEIDDSPDLMELRTQSAVNLLNWRILAGATQGNRLVTLHPFEESTPVAANRYFVVGEGAAPAEMPASVGYEQLTGGENFPWVTSALTAALYDPYGRSIDLVRATTQNTQEVHNHPRAPSAWEDFVGAAVRIRGGDSAFGRASVTSDSDDGGDWRSIFVRSMGATNSTANFSGPVGHDDVIDARLNEGTGTGDGIVLIINAGAANAGARFGLTFSLGHLGGSGPFFGLGADALANFTALANDPVLSGVLDGNGAARIDVPLGAFPSGVQTDDIIYILGPGGSFARTLVLRFDT